MAYRRDEFAHEEWYHCYTRSIDSQMVFRGEGDYERFLQALYLSNGTKTLLRSNFRSPSHESFFTFDRGRPIVAIAAYCLMPNHFHLLLREISQGGISAFMQKAGTSFSMYFNAKHRHIGNVFVKPFRSKHIDDDAYLQRVIQYIHLNPAELFEPEWKKGNVHNMRSLENKLSQYRYSSLPDYEGRSRPENAILDRESMSVFDDRPLFKTILIETAEYYANLDV